MCLEARAQGRRICGSSSTTRTFVRATGSCGTGSASDTGQLEHHGSAAAGRTLDPDPAAVTEDDRARDREPEPAAHPARPGPPR